MNSEAYLLGIAFGLLSRCRTYFIMNDDKEGLLLIENDFIELQKNITKSIYQKKD